MTEHKACPYCRKLTTIQPIVRFEIPQREVFTDRNATLHQCQHCLQVYLSIYEESRVGVVDSEVWNMYYYYLPKKLQQDFLISATLCATPDKIDCACAVHALISQLDFSQLQRLEE